MVKISIIKNRTWTRWMCVYTTLIIIIYRNIPKTYRPPSNYTRIRVGLIWACVLMDQRKDGTIFPDPPLRMELFCSHHITSLAWNWHMVDASFRSLGITLALFVWIDTSARNEIYNVLCLFFRMDLPICISYMLNFLHMNASAAVCLFRVERKGRL